MIRVRRSHFLLPVFAACLCALPCFAADKRPAGVPPIPPVLSVTELGTVVQNPDILGRDGNFSTEVNGESVWAFGDTPLAVPNNQGVDWDDNTLSWTTSLNASQGITLNHDFDDSQGVPIEFLPYLNWEAKYNSTHNTEHCTAKPCGAEFAMWGGPLVWDAARHRLLLFYDEIWRVSGNSTWTNVGAGIAVATPATNGWSIQRPIEDPGSKTPNLMWSQNEVWFTGGSLVAGEMMYSYGCVAGFLVMNCQVARVPLSGALDKTQWTYFAGSNGWSTNPSDAITVFQGGAAGNTVFYDAYLGMYVAIYSGVYSNDVYFRVAYSPEGPWSAQTLLFTGQNGWNNQPDYAAECHPEFSEGNGQTEYVTYVHDTSFFGQELPIVQVVFGQPAQ